MTTATKVGGITLSAKQIEKLRAVFDDAGVTKARKAITLYKAGDEGMAMFRLKASRMILEISARGVASRALTAAQRQYVNSWLIDGNDMFRVYFAELNRALAYDFIQGVKSMTPAQLKSEGF